MVGTGYCCQRSHNQHKLDNEQLGCFKMALITPFTLQICHPTCLRVLDICMMRNPQCAPAFAELQRSTTGRPREAEYFGFGSTNRFLNCMASRAAEQIARLVAHLLPSCYDPSIFSSLANLLKWALRRLWQTDCLCPNPRATNGNGLRENVLKIN